ncbi:hypothetical protein DSM3645_23301 [Blastopirellula marina DSM 3645]|uniref:Transmembrane protein n=1 Tax=Blastopirellula marina DSM 3645 TaxID=314230 RepID=A3ZQ97_9BACT|nr:hypothetical protein DSM3645_23301 [Blastopirellula marina DSM 3645]
MDERPQSDESLNESLADVPPSPVTAPPLSASNRGLNAVTVIVAGAGAFVLLAGLTTPTIGATRSTKLQWEERNLQIEQAVRDAKSCDAQQQ